MVKALFDTSVLVAALWTNHPKHLESFDVVYSNYHSYEVHNGGILGNSNPPLTPPRRGIEVQSFRF